MKSILSLSRLAVVFALLCSTFSSARADDLEKEKKEAVDAVEAFKKSDSTIGKFFSDSAGYAIFPKVGKGGFIVGGAHGTGLVFEKGAPVGRASLSQATIGAQIGGQSFSEVIFFETADALNSLKKSEWAMSAQVGAVAAAEGAGKNAKYQEGVAVFTLVRSGLMAEASVGGQKFKFTPLK
jgi:lipid-binding SYLF domain-containing protein